jgi:hypothetical protein
MPNIVKLAGMTLALALAGHYAQAAEPTVITLSCDGTITTTANDAKPELVNKMGVILQHPSSWRPSGGNRHYLGRC